MDASGFAKSSMDAYLSAEDLNGRQITLTIETIELETFGNDDPKEHKLALFFKDKTKGIVCNKTNTKRLIKAYGADTDGWIGKNIGASPNETPLGLGFLLTPLDFDENEEIPF